jgi:hypothetical protein
VLGMTRDELFDAFSRFVSTQREAPRVTPALPDIAAADAVSDDGDEPGDAIVAERVQPAKAHAKAKPKKRR